MSFGFLLVIPFIASSQQREAYIRTFAGVAMEEMQRTGIPASIKLAQAILESNAGQSTLATRANNHFGMKCGNTWRGGKMYKKDDDRNKRGRLVKSCFRKFGHPAESFIAHSEFLRDENKSNRYGFLFQLEPTDYKRWARGLKKAGYATNPRYPALLIKIIEDYKLYEYDQQVMAIAGAVRDAEQDPGKAHMHPDPAGHSPDLDASIQVYRRAHTIRYQNGTKFIKAEKGERLINIARQYDINPKKLLRYNEALSSENAMLGEGQRIYMQRKKGAYRGSQQFHVVRPGETMQYIADLYGLRTKALYRRNRMQKGLQPAAGERLVLHGKTDRDVRYRSAREAESQLPAQNAEPEITTPAEEAAFFYTVQPKDTLYRIATTHGLSVQNLKKINNLGSDTIHPGQKLRIQQ